MRRILYTRISECLEKVYRPNDTKDPLGGIAVCVLYDSFKPICMTLYQEFPKQSTFTELRHNFTEAKLELVRLHLIDLMHQCKTIDELRGKIATTLRERISPDERSAVKHNNLTTV